MPRIAEGATSGRLRRPERRGVPPSAHVRARARAWRAREAARAQAKAGVVRLLRPVGAGCGHSGLTRQ